jgi:hypothetical protein
VTYEALAIQYRLADDVRQRIRVRMVDVLISGPCDEALAESFNRLYRAEVIHRAWARRCRIRNSRVHQLVQPSCPPTARSG